MNTNHESVINRIAMVYFALLIGAKVAEHLGLYSPGPYGESIYWAAFLTGAMMIEGWKYSPLVKLSFKKRTNEKADEDTLTSEEILAGFRAFSLPGLVLVSLVLSPLIYKRQTIFDVESGWFWPVAITSGILGVGNFYMGITAKRYGDLSVVTGFSALVIVFALPISYALYEIPHFRDFVTPPYVNALGALGICIIVGAVIMNARSKAGGGSTPVAHAHRAALVSWLEDHPHWCAFFSACFASITIVLSKIGADLANPFLQGMVTQAVPLAVSLGWIIAGQGFSRVIHIFRRYGMAFAKVGFTYALVVAMTNISVKGHNVNYAAALKRTAILFSSIYGVYVLGEGKKDGTRLMRIYLALAIVGGVALITIAESQSR